MAAIRSARELASAIRTNPGTPATAVRAWARPSSLLSTSTTFTAAPDLIRTTTPTVHLVDGDAIGPGKGSNTPSVELLPARWRATEARPGARQPRTSTPCGVP